MTMHPNPLRRLAAMAAGLLATLSMSLSAPAWSATPPPDLDAYARQVMRTFETPGMAIAMVERGQPPVLRSFGVRRAGQPEPVDAQTLFPIGSTTKAFASAVLATLVDEGKLGWDTRVVDALPGFRLKDPFASSEMTVRDLLVHRSGLGLGAGDLMFYPPGDIDRKQALYKLRFLPTATSFRSTFAYSNMMYVAAGELIEAASGTSWEQALRARILDPLQMTQTVATSAQATTANRAWPHSRITTDMRGDGPVVPLVQPVNIDAVGPAGSMYSNATEIARWLDLHLNRGLDVPSGKRVFSEAQAREMWTPQMVAPVPPAFAGLEVAQAAFRSYALGWWVIDYRGHKVVAHSGGVPGGVVMFTLVPDKGVGFAVLLNSEESFALLAMQYRLLDHLLGLPSPDWPGGLETERQRRVQAGRATLAASAAEVSKSSPGGARGPSLPLAGYAGRYRDDWYGEATIEQSGKGLRISLQHTPALSGPLEHYRYDTFVARWQDPSLEDAYVTFALKADGSIDRMTMRAVSPLADFSFDYGDLLFRPLPAEAR
jgi:CubicO group peptidase (beta-lactamase class C family)